MSFFGFFQWISGKPKSSPNSSLGGFVPGSSAQSESLEGARTSNLRTHVHGVPDAPATPANKASQSESLEGARTSNLRTHVHGVPDAPATPANKASDPSSSTPDATRRRQKLVVVRRKPVPSPSFPTHIQDRPLTPIPTFSNSSLLAAAVGHESQAARHRPRIPLASSKPVPNQLLVQHHVTLDSSPAQSLPHAPASVFEAMEVDEEPSIENVLATSFTSQVFPANAGGLFSTLDASGSSFARSYPAPLAVLATPGAITPTVGPGHARAAPVLSAATIPSQPAALGHPFTAQAAIPVSQSLFALTSAIASTPAVTTLTAASLPPSVPTALSASLANATAAAGNNSATSTRARRLTKRVREDEPRKDAKKMRIASLVKGAVPSFAHRDAYTPGVPVPHAPFTIFDCLEVPHAGMGALTLNTSELRIGISGNPNSVLYAYAEKLYRMANLERVVFFASPGTILPVEMTTDQALRILRDLIENPCTAEIVLEDVEVPDWEKRFNMHRLQKVGRWPFASMSYRRA